MIRNLTGVIQEVGDNYVVIQVRDIGYLVGFPTSTTTVTVGERITLHTYLAVRETALDLYGFIELTELEMFELLLGVSKVGPKSALQVLNQASPTLLSEAAHKGDATYLQKLSGIGKKTCENIIQHLSNKLDKLPEMTDTAAGNLSQVQTDAIDALISLGYDTTTAREIILANHNEDATVNSLVTEALKQLG